jgi:hypothetical protein
MALILINTQAWSYLILRKPTIQYGSIAYSKNLFHFTCQIIFFSSIRPTRKVVPSPKWIYLHPKTYLFWSSSGCRTIDYTILPLSFGHAAPSMHPPRLICRWHCPVQRVNLTWWKGVGMLTYRLKGIGKLIHPLPW